MHAPIGAADIPLVRSRRSLVASLLFVLCSSLAACSSPSADAAPPARTTPPAAKLPAYVPFAISSVAPAALALSGDAVASQSLEIAYSIPNPETVTDAVLKFYVGELGDIAVVPVTAAVDGRATISLAPRPHSLGAFVQFRAVCPAGTTDWAAMGAIPLDYDARRQNVFRIATVSPQSIAWTPGMDPDVSTGSGSRVFISGPQLSRDCRIEAQVNGRSSELNNVHFHDNRFEGLLMHRDVGYTSISPRYAELKLLVTRAGGQRLQAVTRVPFAAPY